MAWMDNGGYDVPANWYGEEASIYNSLVNGDPVIGSDQNLQLLFDVALFDHDIRPEERDYVMETLQDYLWDEYGIDLDDVMDWEAYKEWYDGVAA